MAQKIEGHPFKPERCMLMAAYGGAFNGIVGHTWYNVLDAGVRKFAAPGTAKFVASKVALDTAVMGPVHVSAFFTVITLAEGGSWDDVKKKLHNDLIPALAAEVGLWPPIQAINFWKVPVQYQLLVVNAFTVLDATFMSWVQHNNLLGKIQEMHKKLLV